MQSEFLLKKKLASSLLDCSLLVVLSVAIVCFLYTGDVPGGSDWATHLSKIRFIIDNLPSFPRWCPEAGFGTPFLHFYPPFSYYFVAILTWILGLNIFEGCKVYFAIVLSIGAISTYALANELRLKRIGCLASGLLLLGSYNIYSWWWIGQLPNITAVMFTPLALLGFLAAVRKETMFSILFAGLLYTPVVLSHLLNTFILGVLLLCTGTAMIILRPELLYVSRGPKMPPKYTMRLPKVLFLSVLEAFALSAWWYLPFLFNLSGYLAKMAGYGVIGTGETAKAIALKFDSLLKPSLYYAGIGQLILVVVSFGFLMKERKKFHSVKVLPFLWFAVSVFGGISPYLGIPIGLPFRFGPYMTLAAALLGGTILTAWEDFYRKITGNRLTPLLLTALLLTCILYQPVMQAKNDFHMTNVKPPEPAVLLPKIMEKGERLGTGSVNWINVFADIPQSYGSVAWTNEFAYKFWYYMYYNHSSTRIPYFARNFNVKYFWEPPSLVSPYLAEVHDRIYEVVDFNSSLVETTDGKILVLFIGEETEYTEYFFLSISATNASDILLVYGGRLLEDLNPETLSHFNIIYLSGLNYRDLTKFTSILKQYVKSGGGLILDTGESNEIPEPFPVSKTAVKDTIFNLTVVEKNDVTRGIDLNCFSDGSPSEGSKIIYAEEIRSGATVLVKDDEAPVIVYWKYGNGKVIWHGLRLPYLSMFYNNVEASEMLVKMIRYASSAPFKSGAITNFDLGTDRVSVNVKEASKSMGIWIKMSYYSGWAASANGKQLEIFKSGPNMMLVFPELDDDYKLNVYYGKTALVEAGEAGTIIGFITILVSFVIGKWSIPRGWHKTSHTGSGFRHLSEENTR